MADWRDPVRVCCIVGITSPKIIIRRMMEFDARWSLASFSRLTRVRCEISLMTICGTVPLPLSRVSRENRCYRTTFRRWYSRSRAYVASNTIIGGRDEALINARLTSVSYSAAWNANELVWFNFGDSPSHTIIFPLSSSSTREIRRLSETRWNIKV